MVISSDNTIFLITNIMYSSSFKMISFYNVDNFTFSSLICILVLTVSACLTIHKLYLSRKIIVNTKKEFSKSLFRNLKTHPFQIFFDFLGFFIVSYTIRTTTFSCLDLDINYNVCIFLIIIFSTWLPVRYVLNIVRQLINWIRVPNIRIYWSMHTEQLNNTVTIPNCVFVLASAAISYYLAPLFIIMSFFHHDISNLTNFKEVYSFFKLQTLEPPSGATGPLDHPFPSNTINDVPDPRSSPNGQNQGPPTVNLGYEILSGQARGSQGKLRVAIFDWSQSSGKRLSELFTAKPYLHYEPTHATEQMVVKGQPRACVIKELMEKTTLHGSNEGGVWVNAFPKNNLGSDHFYVKSAHSNIVREGRRMFLKEEP